MPFRCTSRPTSGACMCMRIKDGTLWLDIQTSRVAPRTHPTPSFTVFKSFHFILSFAAVLATLHHSFVIYSSRGLPTDRPMWSDESGLKECIKGSTYPPSPQWSWVGRIRGIGSSEIFFFFFWLTGILCHEHLFQVSEWAVDYSVPGGTDKEGWQYAADFPTYVSFFICFY